MTSEIQTKRSSRLCSVLLGVFVVGQLIYLPLANLLQLVPREMPAQKGEFDIRVQREGTASNVRFIQESINGLGTAIDRWGELSGQVQAWSLFAPEFGTQSIFPVVTCVPGDGLVRITLQPKIFPEDPANYFRWPGPYSRIFGYEFLLAAVYWGYSEDSLKRHGEEWRREVLDRVRRQQRSLVAYFQWNLDMFPKLDPDSPLPREMILQVAVFPTPRPGSNERPPSFLVPLARWAPDREEPGFLPVEAYDPVARQFVRLAIEEGAR